jgi:hypothetical protein
MSDPYVRRIGEVFGTDERAVIVGVDYGTVSVQVGGMEARLSPAQAEEFAGLFVAATWQAGRQQRQMAGEADQKADETA